MRDQVIKKLLPVLVVLGLIISCTLSVNIFKDESGTFRGRWYNYYDRGLANSERAGWQDAERDLQKTIAMRPQDQRMARTYGMHFIDYFPHRELGIIYLEKGDIDKAINELEISLSQEESAKAVFYLNKARKSDLLMRKLSPPAPAITVSDLSDGEAFSNFKLKISGKVSGQGYISKILINDMPYRIDLARQIVEFGKELAVEEETGKITIVAEDLLGAVSVKTVSIKVDRDGPTINIFEILPVQADGKDVIRITGEVNDSTGINKVMLNNETIMVDNKKNYEFSVIVNKLASSKVIVEAFDSLDNRTTAELDIEKELAAFNIRPEPLLLAFAGDNLFSFDKAPPVINLKDRVDIPAVFVDRYYVEGEVFDNNRVEEIMLNGREISTRKGRKIFFSKVVGLDEGQNNIRVDAFDSAGNKARAEFSVKRNIPSALQVGSRMRMSILPFETRDQGSSLDILAYEHLIGGFVGQKRFNIIERTKLEQVLLEQKLTKEKLTDPKYSIQAGRLMAADAVLATTVNETGNSVEFIARVINTETSEVMEVKDVYSDDKSAASVKQLMNGLASKVAGSFPLVEGTIIREDKKYIYTDLGSKLKIKRDMGIIAYRKGEEIKHPITGKSLGWDSRKLGEGRIEEIHDEFSKARLSDKERSGDIKVKDMVITK